MKITEQIVAYLFTTLFLYAAASKMIDFQNFRIQLSQSPLLKAYAQLFAIIVPALEIWISVMLLSQRWRMLGLYAAFSLMIMFTTYIVTILRFSEYVPCSCGGILQKMHWNTHLVFNVVFALIGFAGVLLYPLPDKKNLLLQQMKRSSRKPL